MGSVSRHVAVIGAGVSGLTAARHLLATGVDVTVFERSSTAGGVWSYDERPAPEPQYPSTRPSIADFVVDEKTGKEVVQAGSEEDIELRFAPTSPAYDGLTNNISTVLQELKGYSWKEGTGDFVNVRVIGDYLQSFSKKFEVEPLIRYNTRVESLKKEGSKWRLDSATLIKDGPRKGEKDHATDEFDAVVVASGHYHASRVPDIPGLREIKAAWPNRVTHSKGYRKPEEFKGQNVLLIGAATSSTDIAREISGVAKKIYQSSRGGEFDLPASFLPENSERVTGIAEFSLGKRAPSADSDYPSTKEDFMTAAVTLTDGRLITDIDRIVICTGYHISYPFLRDFHADFVAPSEADGTILVTDGTQVHNLHKDIFYIPDPSLAFVGAPYYVATFTLFEFQAIAVAAVFSGRAWVPSVEEMRKEYAEKVLRKGVGRPFHSLRNEEVEYVNDLLDWINGQAAQTGGQRFEGHSERWLKEKELVMEKIKQRNGAEDFEGDLFGDEQKEKIVLG